jgi:hypothetical protein
VFPRTPLRQETLSLIYRAVSPSSQTLQPSLSIRTLASCCLLFSWDCWSSTLVLFSLLSCSLLVNIYLIFHWLDTASLRHPSYTSTTNAQRRWSRNLFGRGSSRGGSCCSTFSSTEVISLRLHWGGMSTVQPGSRKLAHCNRYLQITNEKLAGLNTLTFSVWMSRGAGLCLSFDATLILLPMCRTLLRWVRPKVKFLPLDESQWFHRQVAYAMLFWTCIHVLAHYVK